MSAREPTNIRQRNTPLEYADVPCVCLCVRIQVTVWEHMVMLFLSRRQRTVTMCTLSTLSLPLYPSGFQLFSRAVKMIEAAVK